MNCENCGATLRLVAGRGHFICDYCAAVRLIDEPAGPGGDGVSAVSAATGMKCPACGEPLHDAVLDNWPVTTCRRCCGILMARDAFGRIVARRRAAAQEPDITPPPIDPAEFNRGLVCPNCAQGMEVHPYYGPGAVVIDSCDRCDVVWLDHGELRAIERAPGRR